MANSVKCASTGPLPAERGAILALTLVFMLMLAVITAVVMQTAVLELHMAANEQFQQEAANAAQAIANELALDSGNFNLGLLPGQSNCPQGISTPDCTLNLLPAPTRVDLSEGFLLDYRVTREQPLVHSGFSIRSSQDAVSSSNAFNVALFEINVRVDGSRARLGSAHIVQGIAVRIPSDIR